MDELRGAQFRRGLLALSVSLSVMLAGCNRGEPGAKSDARNDGPLPTMTLPATLPLPGTAFPARGSGLGCAARSVAEAVYESPRGDFCVLYSAESSVIDSDQPHPTVTFVYPPAQPGQMEASSVTLSIEDRGSTSGALDAAVDADLASVGSSSGVTITRESATIGGEPAVVVNGVPGMWVGRSAYFIHGGRLYHAELHPWHDEALNNFQPRAEATWNLMIETLKFAR